MRYGGGLWKKVNLVFFILLVIFLLSACSGVKSQKTARSYVNVNNKQALALMDQENPKVLLVDVRTQEEFEDRHIPGSILIPLQELEKRLDELPKEAPLLLICRSGNRSGQAADILVKNGYQEVYNLEKGIIAWPE